MCRIWMIPNPEKTPTIATAMVGVSSSLLTYKDNFMHEHKKHDDFQIVSPPDIDVDYIIAYNYIYPVVLIQHNNIFIRAILSLEYQGESILSEWALQMANYLNP